MSVHAQAEDEACNKRVVTLTPKELPLSCPPLDKRVWDAHPRIYLPIADLGQVLCPYCGTEYILKNDESS